MIPQAAERADTTIVVMGPPRAGATTLIAAVMEASLRDAHGYPEGQLFSLEDLDPDRRLTALGKAFMTGRQLPPELSLDIADYAVEVSATSGAGGVISRILERAGQPQGLTGRRRLVIRDVPSRLLVAAAGRAAGSTAELESLDGVLAQARALVVVWPINRVLDEGESEAGVEAWTRGFVELTHRIVSGRVGRIDSIVVAFSRYEIAVAPAGGRGAQDALDRGMVRAALAATLSRNSALAKALQILLLGGLRVEALPVSAFGFIKGYSEANWDPLSDSRLMSSDGSTGLAALLRGHPRSRWIGHELTESWVPLLVTDPFVRIAFDRTHPLIVPVEELIGGRPPGRLPRAAGRAVRAIRRLRHLPVRRWISAAMDSARRFASRKDPSPPAP